MANTIADDPVALLMQCETNPSRPPVPATREVLTIIGEEIARCDARRAKLKEAFDRLHNRMTCGLE